MLETDRAGSGATGNWERLANAELVIGLPSCGSADVLRRAAGEIGAAVSRLTLSKAAVILYPDELGESAAAFERDWAGLEVAAFPFPRTTESRFDQVHPSLQAAVRLGARACLVWNSDPDLLTAAAIDNFAQPLLGQGFDLAVARYARFRYDSLINSAIVYPLTRALYATRVPFPMATDLGFSARLAERLLRPDAKTGRPAARNWITTLAACEGFQTCQAHLGFRLPPSDSTEVSALLVKIVEPLLIDVERNALHWQRSGASHPTPAYGSPPVLDEPPAAIDVRKLIDSFQLGVRNLREVWGQVLPPATLLQIRKLLALPPENFRMDDDLWARCIYDFALAHRLRVISADHLLRALSPLYLAWVASYATEVQNFTHERVDARLERVCRAFEAQKPYFLSRWRWPDRFSP